MQDIQLLSQAVKDLGGPVYWWRTAQLTCGALAALFTVAALVASWRANVASDRLKRKEVELRAAVDRGAAHTDLVLRRDLRKADVQVARLEKEAVTAKVTLARQEEETADAKRMAAEARAKQQRVEIALAKQEKQAADAKREYLELKERIKPRRLSASRAAQLVQLLKDRPKGNLQVAFPAIDTEAQVYAIEISNALTAAGYPLKPLNGDLNVARVRFGLQLSVHDPKAAPAYLAHLLQALQSIDIAVAVKKDDSLNPDTAVLFVGSKPEPRFQ